MINYEEKIENRKFKKLRINYISKKDVNFMARMGLVIVIGAIIGSMILANYMYTQYQTNFIETNAGETCGCRTSRIHSYI